jgi:hypothetical protein
VFLFANDQDWKAYLAKRHNAAPLAGFAYKNELLLPTVTERGGSEESLKTLCHEVTHAIVARFYPGAKPPLWLNEGFAEYIAARVMALKRAYSVDKYMSAKVDRPMKLDPVFRRIRYGVAPLRGPEEYPVAAFYANAAWCVRTVAEKLPPEGLPRFFNALCAGNSPDAALRFAYGTKCPDSAALADLVNRAVLAVK